MGDGAPESEASSGARGDAVDDADRADEAAGAGNTANTSSSSRRSSDNEGTGPAGRPSSMLRRKSPSSTTIAPSRQTNTTRPSLQRSDSSIGRSVRDLRRNLRMRSSKSFRALKRQSSSIIEGINESLPATPSGWALLALSAASVGLQYELHVQKELTAPPIVFCQNSKRSVLNGRMDRIYEKLSKGGGDKNGGGGNEEEGIFARKVTPSLFIGTRGLVSSTAAYALGDGGSTRKVERVREVMKMGADGALIVLDWEIPTPENWSSRDVDMNIKEPNGIDRPVVLLVHGLNNDSSFGYIRSMMRTAAERGWIAVAMNMRGQDPLHEVKNSTPRGYNAGYTGDLRGVVQQLEHRLKRRPVAERFPNGEDCDMYAGGPIFLLGYSLGANIITKYLGEESLHGTLPACVGGGAAMGNPLHIHSGTIDFPWNMVLGAGVKRSIVQNWKSFKHHKEPGFQHTMKKALLAPTIGKLDDAAAPYLIRNDPFPPYAQRIGFEDGEEYWHDSSSHRYVGHVSVPLLKISAQDDFLVFGQFARKLNHCLENPNVVVVKTRCGGHLGWQESPPPSSKKGGRLGGSGSWSDAAAADFIEALLQVREEDRRERMGSGGHSEVSRPTPPRVMSRL